MGWYRENPTEQEYKDAKSALRWLILAMIFMIVSAVSQVVWFVFLLTNSPHTWTMFIVTIGTFVVGRYCKWCSDDVKPEGWK